MKNPMDLQSILLAAANRSRNQSESGFGVEERQQTTDCGQLPQADNPKLPEGYREIRDAIEELLRYAPEGNDRGTDLNNN